MVKLSTVDLVVLTSSEFRPVAINNENIFYLLNKTSCPNKEVNYTRPSLSIKVSWLGQYIRPLSICPWKKSLHMLTTKSGWKLMPIVR
jgi:hypothetical protein